MSPEDYWGRIERIPLRFERTSADPDALIYRAQDGTPVRVTKPEYLRPEEREDVVRAYEQWYAPRLN